MRADISSAGVVFVASDYSLDPSLDKIRTALRQRGFEVIDGPPHRSAGVTRFPVADWDRYFGRAAVIVTTTRSLIPHELLAAAGR